MIEVLTERVVYLESEMDKVKNVLSEIQAHFSNNKCDKFKKPTHDEVFKYCIERQNTINADDFLNYYESVGWTVGKKPMKNWRAAIRTWEASSREYLEETQSKPSPAPLLVPKTTQAKKNPYLCTFDECGNIKPDGSMCDYCLSCRGPLPGKPGNL